ncbi:MAG: hypothetical protein Q8N79_08890, partial [Candidatus Methanoperedens sp.]|nr:hypothetical protein [Candidatus Methanoperedens sp.]
MGIFSLFKPNVKKMILKDQEEGSHLGRDKLISMGKSAVEPLIQALKNQVYYRDDLTIGENRNYYDALSVQREAALILGV